MRSTSVRCPRVSIEFASGPSITTRIRSPSRPEDLLIRLRPTVRVRGTVVTDAAGIPCESNICIYGKTFWDDKRSFESDSRGAFVLTGLSPATPGSVSSCLCSIR